MQLTTERAFDLVNALAEAADATGMYDDAAAIGDIRAELRKSISEEQWDAECLRRGMDE